MGDIFKIPNFSRGGFRSLISKPPFQRSFSDEFYSILASAQLNGSPCTPGPGNRTSVDTETCMSIIPNYGSSLADQTGVTFGGSNNRCSYADGYAWADFPTGFNFAAHAGLGRIVVMYDSAGRAAWGFIGAAGSGEITDSNLWSTNSSTLESGTYSWTAYGTNTVVNDSNQLKITYVDNPSGAYAFLNTSGELISNMSLDKIYKLSFESRVQSGNSVDIRVRINGITINTITETQTSLTNRSMYFVLNNILSPVINFTNMTTGEIIWLDNFSLNQVLTPSATGSLIYRDASLTVNGWHKPAAFNMNDTAYTFNIYQPTSGGRLFVQGGKATVAYGDPGLWDGDAITRAAGLICAFKVNPKDISKVLEVGLDTDKTGALAANALRVSSSTVIPYNSGSAGPVIAIPTNATEHIMAIILRAAGAKYFMKSGTGYFKKLWETATNSTATLYRGISNYSLTGKVDFLRQPKTLWLPTPLLSDSFTGSAGTNDGRTSDGLGHAETTGLGSGGAGVAWSGASGAVEGSGRLVITPTLGSELATGNLVVGNWYIITATEANHFGTGLGVGYTFRATATTALDSLNKVKLITLATCLNTVMLTTKDVTLRSAFQETTGKQAGFIFGLNDAGTSFLVARHDGNGNIKLEICEAGTYTTKATVAAAYVADAELVVRRDNKEIWVWYNNTLIGSGPTTTLSDTENTNLAGLKAGLFSTDAANTFSYCNIYATGTNDEYSILDRLIGRDPVEQYYGVSWDQSTDTYIRTGLLSGLPLASSPENAKLPIHSLMRRCVANDDGSINYFLDPNDYTKKEDGTASNLTGADGQVVVYIPKFYTSYMFGDLSANNHHWKISTSQLDGFAVHPAFMVNGVEVPYRLYGAYEGYKDTNNKLCSISGVLPTVSQTRATFRTYATNRGAGWGLEDAYLTAAVQLLYLIEYADFDTQSCIGNGITGYAAWPNGPQALTGNSNAIGNATGNSSASVPKWAATTAKTLGQEIIPLTTQNGYTYKCTTAGTTGSSEPTWSTTLGNTVADGTVVWTCVRTLQYMSYRGIENWYGHIWKFTDGININNVNGVGSQLYLCNTKANFSDNTSANYSLFGLLSTTSGYGKALIQAANGFYPASVGGGSTTYLSDYYYTSYGTDGWRLALRGSRADGGMGAGAFYWVLAEASSATVSYFGGRLCY